MQIGWQEIPKELDHLFYALEPLVTGVLMTNILQSAYHKACKRTGTHWQKWGPVYLILIANVLVMIMPMAVLFIYVGEVGYPGSKMWTGGSFMPNQPHGIFFYILKWIGMFLLIIGVVQVTNLNEKIRADWRRIRSGGTPVADSEQSKTVIVGAKEGTQEETVPKRQSTCSRAGG